MGWDKAGFMVEDLVLYSFADVTGYVKGEAAGAELVNDATEGPYVV